MTSYTPKHRRDVDDMSALVELEHMYRDHDVTVARSGPFQHVHVARRRTNDHDAQILMVLSPTAAGVLGLVLQRFSSMFARPMVGLEDYDPGMWQTVAIDLLDKREIQLVTPRLAGKSPAPSHVVGPLIHAGRVGRHMRTVR